MLKPHFLVLFLALTGCSDSTPKLDDETLGKLVPGVTTYREAVALLGEPTNVDRQYKGPLIATYQITQTSRSGARGMVPLFGAILGAPLGLSGLSGYGTPGSMAFKYATLSFDQNGILTNLSSQQTGSPEFVDRSFDPRATETPMVRPSSAPPPNTAPFGVMPVVTPPPDASPPPLPGVTTKRRVALIIGNSAYRNLGQLRNPAADARLLASTLRSLGYTIIGNGPQLNLTRPQFERALQDFGHAIAGAEVAMFYYAGHGLQVDGTNWLVPTDAAPTARKQDLPFQMVNADQVLLQMDGVGTQLNVLILDACRNNPLAQFASRDTRSGLAEMHAPSGSMIAYSTQPGNVALDGDSNNSPYTTALADAMLNRNLDVFHVFNQVGLAVQQNTGGAQVPWMSNSPIRTDIQLAAPIVPNRSIP